MTVAIERPLISVVIPAYNADRTIIDALESVRHQMYRPVEVIVVDDGSTDRTAEMIREYDRSHLGKRNEEEFMALKYLYQHNSGPSKARNVGIKASNGHYIAFLDADDMWTHDKLQKQMRIFHDHPSVDIVFSDVRIMRVRNGTIEEFNVFQKKKLGPDFFGHECMVVNPLEKLMKLNFMPTPSVMLKKTCFDHGRFFNEKRNHVEDWELWLKMSLHCNFAYVNDVCVHVKEMGDGLSSNEREMILSIINIFESFIEENGDRKLPMDHTVLSDSLKTQYKWTGYFLMKKGDKKLARNYFRKSLRQGIDLKTLCYYFNTFLGTA